MLHQRKMDRKKKFMYFIWATVINFKTNYSSFSSSTMCTAVCYEGLFSIYFTFSGLSAFVRILETALHFYDAFMISENQRYILQNERSFFRCCFNFIYISSRMCFIVHVTVPLFRDIWGVSCWKHYRFTNCFLNDMCSWCS